MMKCLPSPTRGLLFLCLSSFVFTTLGWADEVSDQHSQIGTPSQEGKKSPHTTNPEAQWFGTAGLGLFIHWDEASVKLLDCSWPMMGGYGVNWNKVVEAAKNPGEVARIIHDKDYTLTGKPPVITPNQYWDLAHQFNPIDFQPLPWLKKAKEAGFEYAVLTTKHHNGFALWPSAYGNFNTTDTPMKGRDLVKEYVEACRQAGLKVGLYYSGPDWHFDRDYMSFLYHKFSEVYPQLFPSLDGDLEPRTKLPRAEEILAHQAELRQMVRGQLTELLTHYGKIDLLWFDGTPSLPEKGEVFPLEEIRKLQPGIVVNDRFFSRGDFSTPEASHTDTFKLAKGKWGEHCTGWSGPWAWTGKPLHSLSRVLTELVIDRAHGLNYLLSTGPLASGALPGEVEQNLGLIKAWMDVNGEAIHGTTTLPDGEVANVLAAAKGADRYFFLLPRNYWDKYPTPRQITWSGRDGNFYAKILGQVGSLKVTRTQTGWTIDVPVQKEGDTATVTVIKLSFRDNAPPP